VEEIYMNKKTVSRFGLLAVCFLAGMSTLQCVSHGDERSWENEKSTSDKHSEDEDLASENGETILFLDDDRFLIPSCGSLTDDPAEIIIGGYSLKGNYNGTESYSPYLYTDYKYLPLEPLETYRVTFDYRILETPDKGFDTFFYSPIAGQQDIWLPGFRQCYFYQDPEGFYRLSGQMEHNRNRCNLNRQYPNTESRNR
jgi:hypothetical protein